jgi:hypothetical protein
MVTFLTGCGTKITKATDVVELPRTCYNIPEVPTLERVEVELQQLKDNSWAITIDDANFDKLLINQIEVDSYIDESYNTLQKYETECNDSMDR